MAVPRAASIPAPSSSHAAADLSPHNVSGSLRRLKLRMTRHRSSTMAMQKSHVGGWVIDLDSNGISELFYLVFIMLGVSLFASTLVNCVE